MPAILTTQQFKEDVNYLSSQILNEFAAKTMVVFNVEDPDEVESDTAILTVIMRSDEVFTIPFGIRHHEAMILANADADVYLDADGQGAYAYLWLEACERLEALRKEKQGS